MEETYGTVDLCNARVVKTLVRGWDKLFTHTYGRDGNYLQGNGLRQNVLWGDSVVFRRGDTPSQLEYWLYGFLPCDQGWKPTPKPENPVLKEILETQTKTDTYLAKFLKT